MEEEEDGNEPVYFEEALNHQQVHTFSTFSHFLLSSFFPFSLSPIFTLFSLGPP